MTYKSNPSVVFEKLFGNVSDGYNIEIVYENSERVTYCEASHRVTDEKYILSVSDNNIKICCSSEKGAFRALCDLAKRIDENGVCDGIYIC